MAREVHNYQPSGSLQKHNSFWFTRTLMDLIMAMKECTFVGQNKSDLAGCLNLHPFRFIPAMKPNPVEIEDLIVKTKQAVINDDQRVSYWACVIYLFYYTLIHVLNFWRLKNCWNLEKDALPNSRLLLIRPVAIGIGRRQPQTIPPVAYEPSSWKGSRSSQRYTREKSRAVPLYILHVSFVHLHYAFQTLYVCFCVLFDFYFIFLSNYDHVSKQIGWYLGLCFACMVP